MKSIQTKKIDNLIHKVLKETLESKAEKLHKELEEDLGGMEDTHPTFGEFTPEDMEKYVKHMKHNKMKQDDENDEWFEIEPEVEDWEHGDIFEAKSECNECGGMIYEGECTECGWKSNMEESEEVGKFKENPEFDYVAETDDIEMEDFENEDSENEDNYETCQYYMKNFGSDDEYTKKYCIGFNIPELGLDKHMFSMNENSKVKRMKSKPKVTQKPDFLDLDNDGNKKESMKSAAKDAKNKKTQTDEGNAFTKKLKDTPKGGTFKLGGKTYKDNSELEEKDCMECGSKSKYPVVEKSNGDKIKGKVKENFQLTGDQLVKLIETIVKEQKKPKVSKNIKTSDSVPGLKKYKQSFEASGKENDEYLKSVTKKMKDYLKDGSKGEYTTEPKTFPMGNGQIEKMSKKAYVPSNAVQDYTDNLTAAGLENLDYDEIHPNEDWVSKNIEGSSQTGNNPQWANAVETGVNKKRNKIRKDNMLAKIKRKAYNKAPQPIVTDKTGEDDGSKLLMKLESKKQEKLMEEIKKMNTLVSYNSKTQ